MYFNKQNYCHFPSFGKGWFDQVMDNGDHVQMGVQCNNGWDNADHSIARVGQGCQLVCKNLSGNNNAYLPIANNWTSNSKGEWYPKDLMFTCSSPIPLFAFQNENCNRNLIPNEDGIFEKYDDCYKDWVEKGLDLGSQSSHEEHRTA